jgi:hypothetical protein
MAAFYLTAELRWFVNGRIPLEPKKFIQSHKPELWTSESRTDEYIVFPNSKSVGIKLREGNLEIKSWVGELGSVQVGGSDYRIHSWEKLSVPVQGWSSDELETISADKARRVTRFVSGKSGIKQYSPEKEVPEGCDVEISEVEINGQSFWSLCFESFGPKSGLLTVLGSIASEVFPEVDKGSTLNSRKPQSYPEFLGNI